MNQFLLILSILVISLSLSSQSSLHTALVFDGTKFIYVPNDAQTLNPVSGGTSLTFEAWINPSNNQANSNIFSADTSDEWGVYLQPSGSGFNVALVYQGINNIVSTWVVPLNSWTHIAVSWDGSFAKFYIDNNLRDSLPYPIPAGAVQRPGYYSIGGTFNASGLGSSFTGSLDEIRVWSTIRTLTQIETNMNCELTGQENGLISYYKLNETSSSDNTIYDFSPNNFNGHLYHLNNLQNYYPSNIEVASATVNCTTGVTELSFDNQVICYPNPVTNTLTIESRYTDYSADLPVIYDIVGNRISAPLKYDYNKIMFDTKNLVAGTYLVKINSGGGHAFIRKFVKVD